MNRLANLLQDALSGFKEAGTFRQLRAVRPKAGGVVLRDGRRLLDFSSSDYLGLSHHPEMIRRAIQWTEEWGTSARGSRLVTGTLELHDQVETKLAALKGTEAALVFNSGYQANSTILPALFDKALLGRSPLVFTDRRIHASLHHGCRAAGVRQIRFRHNDMNHLSDQLKAHEGRPGPRFIITESLFSMDGDVADLPSLTELADRYGAALYLDDAHATGVMGPKGMGLSGEYPGRIEVAMGAFSKAMGGFGAYIGCSKELKAYLVNRCGGLIYSTALPPAVLGTMDAALDLVPGMEAERRRLRTNADILRQALAAAGVSALSSSTQIVPALIGAETQTLAAAAYLEEKGILGIAIRPPTVSKGDSRIRLVLSAVHDSQAVTQLTDAVADLGKFL